MRIISCFTKELNVDGNGDGKDSTKLKSYDFVTKNVTICTKNSLKISCEPFSTPVLLPLITSKRQFISVIINKRYPL